MGVVRRALMAGALVYAAAFAATTQAHAQVYPYTLIDPGTFAGPESFLNIPAVPLTADGTLLGTADTSTLDADYPNFNPFMIGFPDQYLAHAFEWRDGGLRDLGALPGNNSSSVFEVNGAGVGVGASETTTYDPNTGWPSDHAVMYVHGQVKDLGTLPGGFESQANDINDSGLVSGFASNGIPDPYSAFAGTFADWGTQARSFVWQNGVMKDIGTLGGPDAVSLTLNARGEITGQSYTNSTPNAATGVPTTDPFLWQNGHMRDLGTLGGVFGIPMWMNNSGQVVGYSDLAGDQAAHPFLWNGTRMIDLGTLGGNFGQANWINDEGNVVGWATPPGDNTAHAFLWKRGTITDLTGVGNPQCTVAIAVNARGQVVGNTCDESDALLWVDGRQYDLNTLVAPSALLLTGAAYINDRGDIVGKGVLPDGSQRTFMLIPNPSAPLSQSSTPVRPLPRTATRNAGLTGLMLAERDPGQRGIAATVVRQLLLARTR
jgi:probable HAF family extracellular repeat protein